VATFLAAILPGLLLPLLVAAASWGIATGRAPENGRLRRPGFAAAGLGLAYLAGHVAINGWPELAPAESSRWLFHLVLAATLLAAAESSLDLGLLARLGLRAVLIGSLLWLTLRPLVRHTWSPTASTVWLVGLGAVGLVFLFSADKLARRGPAALQSAVWMATAAAGGLVLLLSASARLGQMSGAVAAALFPAVVLAWRRRIAFLPPGALTAAVTAFAGIWLNGVFYSEVRTLAGLCVVVAPVAAWLGETPWARASDRRRSLVIAVAVALPLVVAIAVAWAGSLRAAAEDPYYY